MAKINFKSVYFVEPTPGSVLLKMLKKTESEYKIDDKCRIKFVEKSGTKFVDYLKLKSLTNVLKKKCAYHVEILRIELDVRQQM